MSWGYRNGGRRKPNAARSDCVHLCRVRSFRYHMPGGSWSSAALSVLLLPNSFSSLCSKMFSPLASPPALWYKQNSNICNFCYPEEEIV